MGINIVDQSASQQMAVALSGGMATQIQNPEEKGSAKRTQDKSPVQRALEAKNSKETSKQILSELASKVASSGIKLNPENFTVKVQQGVKDEYDLLFKGGEESSDSVDLKSIDYAVEAAKRAKQGKNKGGNSGKDSSLDTGKIKEAVQEYTGAYAQFITSGGSDLKKRLERLEAKMRSEGLSEKDMLGFKQSVKKAIRGAIAAQLKEGVLKRILSSPKSLEGALARRGIREALNLGRSNPRLGGRDFGGYNNHLQGTLNEKIVESKVELRDFVKGELERNFISKHLSGEATVKEIRELFKLGKGLGIDLKKLLVEWEEKKFDLGFQEVPYLGPGLQAGTNNSGHNGQANNGDENEFPREQEILINQLRSLYMQRAIRGDMLTKIRTAFKVRKLKNKLIKMVIQFKGINPEELLRNTEKEGMAKAREKTLEMLREAYYERATLYELAGPAYKMIERKIRGLAKNAERLGMDSIPHDALQHETNCRMFDTAREELGRVMILRQSNSSPALEKKEKLLVKLLTRLKEESGIETEIPNSSAVKEAT